MKKNLLKALVLYVIMMFAACELPENSLTGLEKKIALLQNSDSEKSEDPAVAEDPSDEDEPVIGNTVEMTPEFESTSVQNDSHIIERDGYTIIEKENWIIIVKDGEFYFYPRTPNGDYRVIEMDGDIIIEAGGTQYLLGENVKIRRPPAQPPKTGSTDKPEEPNGETNVGDTSSTSPQEPAVEDPRAEIRPFNQADFNAEKAAWETKHPEAYNFTQTHSGPGMYLSIDTDTMNGISEPIVLKNGREPLLLCNSISELYEKIDKLWTEQQGDEDVSFFIRYDYNELYPNTKPLHFPTFIQIKNINDSGNDYTVEIKMNHIYINKWSEPW